VGPDRAEWCPGGSARVAGEPGVLAFCRSKLPFEAGWIRENATPSPRHGGSEPSDTSPWPNRVTRSDKLSGEAGSL